MYSDRQYCRFDGVVLGAMFELAVRQVQLHKLLKHHPQFLLLLCQ